MENDYIIYCHLNKINNKRYIGQTKMPPSKRWGHNGLEYLRKGNDHFKRAIQKYGWDNFEHIILFENLTKKEANEKEKEMIKKYNSNNPLYGYNKTVGGSSNTLSEQQKEEKRQLNYKMWADGSFKQAINTPVYCIELDLNFESAIEAERQTGINNSNIQKVCKHENNYAGFMPNGQPIHWIYQKEKTPELILQLKNKKEIIKGTKIPVECLETHQIFESSTAAEKFYNLPTGAVRKCCVGIKESAGIDNNKPLHWIAHEELIKNKNKITLEKLKELKNE